MICRRLGGVFLLLDGFDEIKDEKAVQSLNNWMQGLHHHTSVLITTRPYAANRIVPNSLYTKELRCMTLREYNEAQHKDYIHKYLDMLFKEICNEHDLSETPVHELGLLADTIYEQLKSLISKSTARLLGIPLESYTFCEALRPHIKEQWLKQCSKSEDVNEGLDQTPADPQSPSPLVDKKREAMEVLDIKEIFTGLKHLNAATLYQHFILSKLQMFLQKHMQMSTGTTLKLKHRIYALAASYTGVLIAFAFKQAFSLPYYILSTVLKRIHYTAEMIPELSDTGLVEIIKHDNEYILKFNHETYQEYFAALHILKGLAEGEGELYNAAKQAIIEHCYIPKYRMIMIMAAQLSLSADPIIPAWRKDNEEQVRRFWEILANSGDVLGAASSRLLKDCLQGLSPEQIEKLSAIIKDCIWATQVLKNIETIKKEHDDREEIRENDAQDIDNPFEAKGAILQGEQEKMRDEKKSELKSLFKDKSKVVAETKNALLTIRQDDIAKIFEEIVSEENTLNSYWDIDGGFQAMALLGNSFNMHHANYFVKKVKIDPSWRAMPAFEAVRSLLAQSPQGEAKTACEKVIACVAEYYEHISPSRELSAMLKTFFKPIMEALFEKFRNELSDQTVIENITKFAWPSNKIEDLVLTISKAILDNPIFNFIKMLTIAYQANYAVIPIEKYQIRFVGDIQIPFVLEKMPLMKIFQKIIKSIFKAHMSISNKEISHDLSIEEVWKKAGLNMLYEHCKDSVFAIVVGNKEMFRRCFEQVKVHSWKLHSFYNYIAEHGLIAKHHVDRFVRELVSENSQAMQKGSRWSFHRGIAITQFCWKYFNKEIADYLVFRAGCWQDNLQEVKKALDEIRKLLLANPTDDETYQAAVEAYNFAAGEVNKDPNGWLNDEKIELITSQETQVRFLKAAKHNNKDEVKRLLETTIDVNIQDAKGRTPLYMTARRGNIELAQMLILHQNININLEDKKGRTALDIAEKYNYEQLVRLLLDAGAKQGRTKLKYKKRKTSLDTTKKNKRIKLETFFGKSVTQHGHAK